MIGFGEFWAESKDNHILELDTVFCKEKLDFNIPEPYTFGLGQIRILKTLFVNGGGYA